MKLLSSPWIDVALIYRSGRRAILTLEKNATAEKLFSDALSAWDSSPYVVSGSAEVTDDRLKAFVDDRNGAQSLPQDVGRAVPISNDTRAAIAGDSASGFECVGVWAETIAACATIDKPTSGRFAVLTRTTFRAGPHAYFGNFGALVDGTMRITVRSSSGTRQIFLTQRHSDSLEIDGRSFVRCTSLADASSIAAVPEVPRLVDIGL